MLGWHQCGSRTGPGRVELWKLKGLSERGLGQVTLLLLCAAHRRLGFPTMLRASGASACIFFRWDFRIWTLQDIPLPVLGLSAALAKSCGHTVSREKGPCRYVTPQSSQRSPKWFQAATVGSLVGGHADVGLEFVELAGNAQVVRQRLRKPPTSSISSTSMSRLTERNSLWVKTSETCKDRRQVKDCGPSIQWEDSWRVLASPACSGYVAK